MVLRAFAAVDLTVEARALEAAATMLVSGLCPSLPLSAGDCNVGDCSRKLGNLNGARDHVQQGMAAEGHLVTMGTAS